MRLDAKRLDELGEVGCKEVGCKGFKKGLDTKQLDIKRTACEEGVSQRRRQENKQSVCQGTGRETLPGSEVFVVRFAHIRPRFDQIP